MSLRQVYRIARREYIALVRNKAFVITTLMVPAFLAFYVLVMPQFFEESGDRCLTVAILDRDTGLGEELRVRLEDLDMVRVEVSEVVRVREGESGIREEYSEAILQERLDGYLVLTPDERLGASARYFARETGNPVVVSTLESAYHAVLLEARLAGSGVDPQAIREVQRSDLVTVTVSERGEEEGGFETAFFGTFIFGMLLYMAVLISGQGMAMSIVEEKSSRLIEVILGSVTAVEFMTGKILGVLLSGLTQLAIWMGCSLIAGLYALPALAVSGAGGFDLMDILRTDLLVYFSLFFILGYLLYSSMFASVAATCSTTQELGQAILPAMLPLILSLLAVFYAIPNPSAIATRVLSWIPLFSPLVMLARINVLKPPFWEILLSMILLLLTGLASFWVAGKIFRVALLMHGKRPTFPELWRMIRLS